MLADAGVELGVTYPCPVISLEESEEHLQIAAKVIQETLAASIAASQVRLESVGNEVDFLLEQVLLSCTICSLGALLWRLCRAPAYQSTPFKKQTNLLDFPGAISPAKQTLRTK